MENMEKAGTIYVVATPIGNLEDMTLRAKHILREVDFVIAEDTRVTRKLLHHLSVGKEIVRYDENRVTEAQAKKLITPVLGGKDAALVTDAGTPNVSDPGWKILKVALAESDGEIQIVPIPGASALTALISVAHFPLNSFVFLGFPPTKKGRKTYFKELADEPRPIVLYEAPHRIKKTLTSLAENMPSRDILVGKELTKLYERLWRGSVEEVAQAFDRLTPEELKGEFVLAIAPEKHGKK